jgi:LPS-assembly protein
MHLPTVFRPRLKPLARLLMLAGGLPLAVAAGEQEAMHLEHLGATLTLALAPAASASSESRREAAVGPASATLPESAQATAPAQAGAEEPARIQPPFNTAEPESPATALAAPEPAPAEARSEPATQADSVKPPENAQAPAPAAADEPARTLTSFDTGQSREPATVLAATAQAAPDAQDAAQAATAEPPQSVAPVASPAGMPEAAAATQPAALRETNQVLAQAPEQAAEPASAGPGAPAGEAGAGAGPVERSLRTSTQLSAAPVALAVTPVLEMKVAAAPLPADSAAVPTTAPVPLASSAAGGMPAPSTLTAAASPGGAPASAAPAGAAVPVNDAAAPSPQLPGASGEAAAPAGDRLSLKTEPDLKPERGADEQVPVFVQGLKISGQTGVQTTVEGDAELRKRASQIKADSITYWPPEDEMLATGNVRTLKNGDLFTGTELRLKLDAQTGYYMNVNYLLAGEKARGEARRLDFLGQDAYNGEDATYTTCGPGNDDWFMKVGKLNLDFGRDVGEAEQAKIVFMGREIMYLPSMSFPLNDKRKSGFLTPSFGNSVIRGAEVLVPYYWNIAPNRDMTITERGMTKRGLQTAGVFRYLGENYKGTLSGEILPNDAMTKTTRSGFSLLHWGRLTDGLAVSADYNKVSDNAYFTDLASRVALTAQTNLNRELAASYNVGKGYYFQARTLSYQTLQDPLSPITVPYFRLPDLTFGYNKYDAGGFDLSLYSNFTRFSHATQVMGSRVYVNPAISYPFITPGFYITPKVELSSTRYNLQELGAWQNNISTPANAQPFITRNLPIVSVDTGMTFERQANLFGKAYTQTLEPRLYYLRVPYRDQSNIPIFDTGAADFNFSQIFSNNVYSGYDRIADANQITAAISTRLLSTETGAERLRFSLGQRYYFTTQRVTLPTEAARTDRTSDFLAAVSGDIVPNLRFDSAVEYNPNAKQIERVSHGVRYSPEPGNTVSAAYRFQRGLLEQVDLAAQWRLAPRWYGVGRYNFSIRDGRVVESLGGFEYDGDCWVGRVVVQRNALATQKASTSIFFQIELNGLSRLGSNPLEILRRAIPGYTKLNDNRSPDPRTLTNYE